MSREVKERTILDKFAEDFVNVVEKNKSGYPQVEIMRDITHTEQVIRWAEFVKTHPRSIWIREVGTLIDAQIIMKLDSNLKSKNSTSILSQVDAHRTIPLEPLKPLAYIFIHVIQLDNLIKYINKKYVRRNISEGI